MDLAGLGPVNNLVRLVGFGWALVGVFSLVAFCFILAINMMVVINVWGPRNLAQLASWPIGLSRGVDTAGSIKN